MEGESPALMKKTSWMCSLAAVQSSWIFTQQVILTIFWSSSHPKAFSFNDVGLKVSLTSILNLKEKHTANDTKNNRKFKKFKSLTWSSNYQKLGLGCFLILFIFKNKCLKNKIILLPTCGVQFAWCPLRILLGIPHFKKPSCHFIFFFIKTRPY